MFSGGGAGAGASCEPSGTGPRSSLSTRCADIINVAVINSRPTLVSQGTIISN